MHKLSPNLRFSWFNCYAVSSNTFISHEMTTGRRLYLLYFCFEQRKICYMFLCLVYLLMFFGCLEGFVVWLLLFFVFVFLCSFLLISFYHYFVGPFFFHRTPICYEDYLIDHNRKSWAETPTEVRQDYGEEYFDAFLKQVTLSLKQARPNLLEVSTELMIKHSRSKETDSSTLGWI